MQANLFARLSIKSKQIALLVLTSSVAFLLAATGFGLYELFTMEADMESELADLALDIGRANSGPLLFSDPEKAEANLHRYLRDHRAVVTACIYDSREQKPFATYPATNSVPPQFPASLTANAGPRSSFQFFADKLEVFSLVVAGADNGGEATVVPIYLCSSLDPLYARLEHYCEIVVLVFAGSMAVVLLISSRLQRLVSGPILHLLDTTKSFGATKDYAIRATKSSNDELGALIDSFNAMLDLVQERDVALQKARDELEKRVEERTLALRQEIGARMESEKALQQQLTRISLLNHITHAISERQNLQSVNYIVLDQLENHLPVDFGAVLLFDAREDRLTCAAARTRTDGGVNFPNDLVPGSTFNPDELGLRDCVRGRTVYLGSQPGETAMRPIAQAGFRFAVASPLVEQSNALGILVCARANQEFSAGECEFLRMLSEQVALAAHQAALYTQLQKAYNDLRQTQQSVIEQERLRALGSMASGIAHDINNALSPVVVYSEMLLRDDHGQSPENVKRFLQNIKTSGEDIAHIVSRMREFYRRREQDEMVFACNLNDLAIQVADLTRPRWRDIPLAHGSVVEVKTELEPSLPDIAGNASELREAITNLVLNSVDAMPSGGRILLRTATVLREPFKGESGAPSQLMIEVRDTGIGMDEETRRRCLEPFFTTKGKRGTGLGLAMVYGVAERHEARIEIESAPGKGTSVKMFFPVARIAPARPGVPGPLRIQARRLRILCVDDEPMLRMMLKELLELEGHDVELADNGETGAAAFMEARAKSPFDVVITDLGMPHIDGRQLAIILKKAAPETPVIMLTGWGTMMKSDGDLPAQVDWVLSKPPLIDELREALRQVMQRAVSTSQGDRKPS